MSKSGNNCCLLGHKACCSSSIGIPAHPKPECIGKGGKLKLNNINKF